MATLKATTVDGNFGVSAAATVHQLYNETTYMGFGDITTTAGIQISGMTKAGWGGSYTNMIELGTNCAIGGNNSPTSNGVFTVCNNCYFDGDQYRTRNTALSRQASAMSFNNSGNFYVTYNAGAIGGTVIGLTTVFNIDGPSGNLLISGTLIPTIDNSKSVGTVSNRWSTIYAGTGAINTSDERDKVFYSTEASEKAAALEIKSIIKKFKFKDAIAEKGEENARIHYGVGAQSVVSILQKHGLNPFEYAFMCYDEWDALEEVKDDTGIITQQARSAGDKYGIRYEELAMFILGAM